MCLLFGNSQLESDDSEGAIQSFERARVDMRYGSSWPFLMVSLVSFFSDILQRTEIAPIYDRYPDGNLIISTSQFDSVCVRPCLERAAPRMRPGVSTKLQVN